MEHHKTESAAAIVAICLSPAKGTAKTCQPHAVL